MIAEIQQNYLFFEYKIGVDSVNFQLDHFIRTIVFQANKTTYLIFTTPLMKENYKKYCDAVSIDATYNTNKYLMPLVTFVGINNDGKIIAFGKYVLFSFFK